MGGNANSLCWDVCWRWAIKILECFLSFIPCLTRLGHIQFKLSRYCLVWEGFRMTIQLCACVISDSQDKPLNCWHLDWVSTWAEMSHRIFPIFCTLKWPISSSYPQNWSPWPSSKSFLLCSSFGWKNASLNPPPPTYAKVLLLNWSFFPTEEKVKLFCLCHQNSDSDDKHRERLDVSIADTFNKSWHCKF